MRVLVIFLLGIHHALAAIHTLQYFYTGTSGIANIPEFMTAGVVDGQQIDYYDSVLRKAVQKADWISGAVDPDYWNRNTQIYAGNEPGFKENINIVKSRFNQTGGVHTVQQMYSCEWDDETGAKDGFLQFGYDGEDFLTLDLKEMRFISPVQQGIITAQKWNNNRGLLEIYKQYFTAGCIEWLKKYVEYGKSEFGKKVSPQVSLLQKDSSSPLVCHATGFYPSGVKISWMRNGQEHEEDVDLGQILPNEDGTFQRTSTLRVKPDDLKQFSCVVEHQGKTEIITNDAALNIIAIVVGCLVALVVVVAVIGLIVWKKRSSGYGKTSTHDTDSENSDQPLPKAT